MIRDAIDEALGAVGWGGLVDEDSRRICARHAERVLEINETLNLTRVTDPAGVAVRHILDSYWALPVLDAWERDAPRRYLDFGSGGGWPFVPLAAHFACEAWACEKTGKKVRVLRSILEEVLPRAKVFDRQVRELRKPVFDLVTSRAVGRLEDTFENSAHCVAKKGGVWMAYKGPSVEEELAAWRAQLAPLKFKELPLVEAELPDGSRRCFVGAYRR